PGLTDRLAERLHERHRAMFTYDLPEEEVVLVHAKLAAVGRLPERVIESNTGAASGTPQSIGMRKVVLDGNRHEVPLYDFAALSEGVTVQGPAIIESDTTTVVLHAGDRG